MYARNQFYEEIDFYLILSGLQQYNYVTLLFFMNMSQCMPLDQWLIRHDP